MAKPLAKKKHYQLKIKLFINEIKKLQDSVLEKKLV
jgi:hypothetical protein